MQYQLSLFQNFTTRENQELKMNFDALVKNLLSEGQYDPEDAPMLALQKLEDEYLEKIPHFIRALANWMSRFRSFAESSGIPAKQIENDTFKKHFKMQ